ncbi:MAG TPA: glycosyltransferase family 2 protein [Candidatus Sulfotelmatobacter sp.]|nr:glycosyltransferase family 2 protein [Candidatus Sulfotelmatobacter sp.]
MNLSVVIITFNEEANIGRTLASVQPLVANGKGEIIVVDSGSTDRTVEIAKSFGAKVFVEEWKGFAAQKNSAIDKATGDWILSLDADEELGDVAREFVLLVLSGSHDVLSHSAGFWLSRRNYFLGRWMRHGGFYPDAKLRMFRRGSGHFEDRSVHEDVKLEPGQQAYDARHYDLGGRCDLIHHSYPTLSDYIEHMNRYSSLGAEMVVAKGKVGFSVINIVLRPLFTFIYNYFFRLGFLDGREGLLLHLYHAVYVSWKYAKAWELSRQHQSKLSS